MGSLGTGPRQITGAWSNRTLTSSNVPGELDGGRALPYLCQQNAVLHESGHSTNQGQISYPTQVLISIRPLVESQPSSFLVFAVQKSSESQCTPTSSACGCWQACSALARQSSH